MLLPSAGPAPYVERNGNHPGPMDSTQSRNKQQKTNFLVQQPTHDMHWKGRAPKPGLLLLQTKKLSNQGVGCGVSTLFGGLDSLELQT